MTDSHARRSTSPVREEAGRTGQVNELTRAEYTTLYGPTTRDRVRLADTDLTLEIEAD